MIEKVDFTKLKTSWTKYDVVQVMEVIYSKEILYKFINKEAGINEPTLRAFLGIKSLKDPLPNYWIEIQKYPNEKNIFALFAVLFTHGEIIQEFAQKYSKGNMKGVFILEDGKQYTNIRSALIVSGAAAPIYRRTKEVPFDFSPIFQNLEVGKLFKQVLEERISRLINTKPNKKEFYDICYSNNFHKALCVSKSKFKSWLEGIKDVESSYIEKVQIANFFSIEEVKLDHIESSKEIYFLGENGDGKSLILMAIYLAFNRYFIIEKTDKEQTGKVIDIINSNREMELVGIDDKNKEYRNKNVGFLNNFFAYGVNRGRYSSDNSEEYGFMSLFDNNQTLTNPISWLLNQRLLNLEKQIDSQNAIGEVKELPSSFPIDILEKMFHELLERNVEIKVDNKGVSFKEKNAKLEFDELSEGYKSILIFVSDLLYRLQLSQPKTRKLENLHGIVLVDEIGLHLHPKWKRTLVGRLRSLLPNVQFMFTTHSSTIIQGASDDAVIYRVFRNPEDGKTRVSDPYYRKDLNHLMINSLLTSPLFGLENSRLDAENDDADTSDTYLLYRINNKLKDVLKKQKLEGKTFIPDDEIDTLIQKIIDEELG